MSKRVNISVLADETAGRIGLVAEHAWSVWIEMDSRYILFDVGQRDEVVRNAEALNIELGKSDTIVLSHGHYDHTGGLTNAVSMAPNAKIYAHPLAVMEKFALNSDGTSRNNGMPKPCRELLGRHTVEFTETSKPTHLGSKLWTTGEIPRKTEFEDAGGDYFIESYCTTPDPIRDDQALFFESTQGIVVILGCAHAGVINTIEYIRELTSGKKIHAILGGMHLIHASDERIQSTIEGLMSIEPDLLGLAHCTGTGATEKLLATFRGKCTELSAGTQLLFEVV